MRFCCRIPVLLLVMCFAATAVMAVEHAVTVRPAVVYISPDNTSAKLVEIERGRELAILEKSGDWVHVTGVACQDDKGCPGAWQKDATGWMLDKGIVRPSTPNGDKVLFGEAVDSESEASRRGGRRGAAKDAMRLYAMVVEYFPNSPLAGEAAFRAADDDWQLQAEDIRTRPSAKLRDPDLHAGFQDERMKDVVKKFPHTKWADLAAFRLLDPKLCGDWEMRAKCPEREADMYEKYAAERPQSPAAAEALYNAAWRRSALIQIYKLEGNAGHIPDAKKRATELAQRVISQYPQTDWADRAQRLIFLMDQNIPTIGNTLE